MTGLVEGLPLWQIVAIFAVAAGVLIGSGISLARSGDEIATRTGMGGLLVGVLLASVATSLPEVVADVSAAVAGAPDLAVADLFGSSMANMAIFAVIDLTGRRAVWPAVDLAHARIASMAIGLTAVALLALTTPTTGRLGWVGLDTIVIGLLYVVAVTWVRRARARAPAAIGEPGLTVPTGWSEADVAEGQPLERGVASPAVRFAISTVVIFVSAPITAVSAKGIADASGIGEGFVGVALLALVTSLPELVASTAAVRIGAYDLAVGNLFGSNAFNMVVLLFADVAYTRGRLLSTVDPGVQVVAGIGAVLLMTLALAAIVHGEETRIRRMEPDAVGLLLVYLVLLVLVFSASS